jgi:hypothetical protein
METQKIYLGKWWIVSNISITAGRDGGLPKDEKSGLTRI